jgi:hypothetical protein
VARTQEQRQADDALRKAIEAVKEAYYPNDGREVLADYVVLTASMRLEDGQDPEESSTAYNYFLPDGNLAWYRIVGLLETSLVLMKHDMEEGTSGTEG